MSIKGVTVKQAGAGPRWDETAHVRERRPAGPRFRLGGRQSVGVGGGAAPGVGVEAACPA